MLKKWLNYTIFGIIIFIIIASILSFWLPILESMRVVFSLVYLLFLPGFVWSWVFWQRNELDGVERFIFSLVLSTAIVPLVVYFLSKIGVKINLLNSFLEILGIILLGLLLIYFPKFFSYFRRINFGKK